MLEGPATDGDRKLETQSRRGQVRPLAWEDLTEAVVPVGWPVDRPEDWILQGTPVTDPSSTPPPRLCCRKYHQAKVRAMKLEIGHFS